MDCTVVILTRDEEINIADCINSIGSFAARIVVVDSESVDKTREIAASLGAEVVIHPFENYARQFNWALDNLNIKTKWTMRLDADERLTPALISELEGIARRAEGTDINGIAMEAWLYFLGRRLKHGGHQKRKLMLFKTGIGRIEDRRMDEHTYLLEGRSVSAKEKFLHYDFRDITYFIKKLNWYASREMEDYFADSDKQSKLTATDRTIARTRRKKQAFYYRFPMFVRSHLLFIYVYFFRLGFLDGREGFLYHWLYHRWYRLLVDAKIYEQRKSGGPVSDTKGALV